jgi:cell division septum initiation protein DivIVA
MTFHQKYLDIKKFYLQFKLRIKPGLRKLTMHDIINEVLLTEKRVEEILQKARSEAESIKLRTEKVVSQKIAEARTEAQKIIQNAVETAKREAENIRDTKLKEVDLENADALNKNRAGIEGLVNEIVKLIMQTGYEEVIH